MSGYKKQKQILKNDDGNLITIQEIGGKWTVYFKYLFNCKEPIET